MPTYTTLTSVKDELPSSLPASLTDALLTTYITAGSAQVDARVGRAYPFAYNSASQKFPEITDSVPTPSIIEECARQLAAFRAYVKLKEINKADQVASQGLLLRGMALETLQGIRRGDIDVILSGASLATATDLWSSTEDRDITFTRAVYEDGTSDESGTLDDFADPALAPHVTHD